MRTNFDQRTQQADHLADIILKTTPNNAQALFAKTLVCGLPLRLRRAHRQEPTHCPEPKQTGHRPRSPDPPSRPAALRRSPRQRHRELHAQSATRAGPLHRSPDRRLNRQGQRRQRSRSHRPTRPLPRTLRPPHARRSNTSRRQQDRSQAILADLAPEIPPEPPLHPPTKPYPLATTPDYPLSAAAATSSRSNTPQTPLPDVSKYVH